METADRNRESEKLYKYEKSHKATVTTKLETLYLLGIVLFDNKGVGTSKIAIYTQLITLAASFGSTRASYCWISRELASQVRL